MIDSKIIRNMDKNFGQVICFIFSLLNVFKRKKKHVTVKNILVLELFEMGAGVMAYPAIRYLQKNYESANIYCLCTDSVRQSWECLNIIPRENILSINSKTLFQFGSSLLKRIIQLRRIKIDLVIDFELFMRISSIIVYLIGGKLKAGFYRYEFEGLYRGNFYDYRVAFNQNTHITKNFLALTMAAVHQKNDYPNPKLHIKLEEHQFPVYQSQPEINKIIRKKIQTKFPGYQNQPIILLTPDVGKNLAVRNYPKELFALAIKKILAEKSDHLVLIIGVKENKEICSWIEKEVNHQHCIDFCGDTASLQELFELITCATLLIGNDNGPLHFASMTPCKILGLFSTDSPFLYGPIGNCVVLYQFFHCSPCISAYNHKRSRCADNLCPKALDSAVVSDYAIKILEDKLPYHKINNSIPYLF